MDMLNDRQNPATRATAAAPAAAQPINLTVYLGDEQVTDRIRVVADRQVDRAVGRLARDAR